MKRMPASSTRNAPSPRTASHTSGCCPRECAPEPGDGRMELHELDVADHRSGAQREPPPRRRSRRSGWWSTRRPGRCRRWRGRPPAPGSHPRRRLPLAHDVQRQPGRRAVGSRQQVEDERVLDHPDIGRVQHARHERPLDLRAGRVATGVRDAVAVVAALAAEGQRAVGAPVEARADLGQLAHRGRPLAHQRAHRGVVAHAGAGDDRVDEVLVGRVAGAERGGDAALRPPRRTGGEDVLGHEQHAQRRLPADVQRRRQPGDARADDDDVGLDVPAGSGAASRRGTRRSRRSPISTDVVDQAGAYPTRAATSSRAGPWSGISPRSAPRSSR